MKKTKLADKKREEFNPLKEEQSMILNVLSDKLKLESFIKFATENRVEVLAGADLNYQCFINYKEGDRPQSVEFTPLGSMVYTFLKQEQSQTII